MSAKYPQCIALKSMDRGIDDESKSVQLLNSIQNTNWVSPYGELKYAYAGSRHYSNTKMFLAMEWMDGSLEDLMQKCSMKDAVAITFEVCKAVESLFRQNLIYNDLKCANVLYRCIGQNEYRILLGDIGSIHLVNTSNVPTTYISMFSEKTADPQSNEYDSAYEAIEQNVTWGLTMLFIELCIGPQHDFSRHYMEQHVNHFNKRSATRDEKMRFFLSLPVFRKSRAMYAYVKSLLLCVTLYEVHVTLENYLQPTPIKRRLEQWFHA
jgi:serine/threonine protein kinase